MSSGKRNCPTRYSPFSSVRTSIVSITDVPLLIYRMWTCTGKSGAGTKPVSSNQKTDPLNMAGRFSSSQRTGLEYRVILVGILSSSSRIPSLSASQSELKAPSSVLFDGLAQFPSEGLFQLRSTRPSPSSSTSK